MAVLIPWPLTSLSSRSSSGFSADVGALPARAPAARTAPSSPTVLAFPFLSFRFVAAGASGSVSTRGRVALWPHVQSS